MGYLCEFLKPVFFIERTRIIREGDPIDEMLFVLKGNLWTYTSRNVATTSSNSSRCRENRLKDGDFKPNAMKTKFNFSSMQLDSRKCVRCSRKCQGLHHQLESKHPAGQ